MGRKRWITLLCLALFSSSTAETLEKLLEKYHRISQLYRQTAQESEGHLIVFTRQDIERFQYYTLSELLEGLRYFTLQRNQSGDKVLSYATIYPIENSTVRLFINDHEVSSVFRKTALPLWADLPLDFVEHIEVYQGESAVKFNNEAAGMIIKVYTKRPERENGGQVKAGVDTRKGMNAGFYAGLETSGETAFSFFINRSRQRSKGYFDGEKELSIDDRHWYSYLQYRIRNWNIEVGFTQKNSNKFRGTGLFYGPDKSYFNGSHGYVSVSKMVSPELNLLARVYLDRINASSYQEGNPQNPILALMPVEPVLWWDVDIDSYKVGFDFNGKKRDGRLLFAFGGKFQRTGYRIENTRPSVKKTDSNNEGYTSLFFESTYNLISKLGFIAGVKLEKMERKYGPDINNLLWRLGAISVMEEGRYFKAFLSRYYTPPYFIEIYTNPDLQKQKNDVLTFELSEKNRFGRFVFTGGYIKVKRSIMIDTGNFTYYNSRDTLKYKFYSVDYYKKNKNWMFKAGFFNVSLNNKKYKTAPSKGGIAGVSYGREGFSTFIELVYREGYVFGGVKIPDGYQLNGGFRKRVFENGWIELKGYNLLNRGLKTPAYIDPDFKYFLVDRQVSIRFIREF